MFMCTRIVGIWLLLELGLLELTPVLLYVYSIGFPEYGLVGERNRRVARRLVVELMSHRVKTSGQIWVKFCWVDEDGAM